jgi:hypothetical protein
MSISHAHREGTFCEVDHIADIRITILSSLITDVVLLSLMLIGVLRWKKARLTGGIWRIMYQQVRIPHLAVAAFNSMLVIGINMGHNCHACGYTSHGAYFS